MNVDFFQAVVGGWVVGIVFVVMASWFWRSIYGMIVCTALAGVGYYYEMNIPPQAAIGAALGYVLTIFVYWFGYYRGKPRKQP